MLRRTSILLSCLFQLLLLAAQTVEGKRLVLFAGPHAASAESVQTFFYNHASGAEGKEIATGLNGWRWPVVDAELWLEGLPLAKTAVFDALVKDADNATAQDVLLQAISKAWDASTNGIVVGTAEFDKVGDTLYSNLNGMEAMQSVVDHLQVRPENVTVVLNYVVPRLEQWLSIWRHADATGSHYKRFICGDNEPELYELLDTAMNPLELATRFRGEWWNVVLMDMGGVRAMGHDISHAIACNVLDGTTCQGGFVVPVTETYPDPLDNVTLSSLDPTQHDEMDQLFRERDCYLEQFLKNDKGFKIQYKDTIWQGCIHSSTNEELYKHLDDDVVLLGAIRSQKRCSPNGNHKMETVLVSDDYESMIVSTIFGTDSSENGTSNAAWVVPLLLFSLLGFGVFYVKRIKGNNVNFFPAGREIPAGREMKGMGGGSRPGNYHDDPHDLAFDASPAVDHGELM